ncbi:MAG: AAA family ATPase [Planctomycetaceae bacterium]
MSTEERLVETVTLSQAKTLLSCAAQEQSFLLLSPPGVGKSDMVAQAARDAGLECKSLLGTQIAPEDVTGVPHIVGERSVFCPPRVLLPEVPEPFCLFLDELPACPPDIQKAFYSLLLERRLGEHLLPGGTWVVAAGNRAEDKALVRTISSALVNRLTILQIRVDVGEWLTWARGNGVRRDVITFIEHRHEALQRPMTEPGVPFSTPRAWASLSRALDLAEQAGILDSEIVASLTEGRVSPQDTSAFCLWQEVVARVPQKTEIIENGVYNLLARPIDDLQLPQRVFQTLQQNSITVLSRLIECTPREVLKLFEGDQLRLQEVQAALENFGLVLGRKM